MVSFDLASSFQKSGFAISDSSDAILLDLLSMSKVPPEILDLLGYDLQVRIKFFYHKIYRSPLMTL